MLADRTDIELLVVLVRRSGTAWGCFQYIESADDLLIPPGPLLVVADRMMEHDHSLPCLEECAKRRLLSRIGFGVVIEHQNIARLRKVRAKRVGMRIDVDD